MQTQDWSDSTLGHPNSWPSSLRSVVRLVLNSKFPMFLAWGAELGFIYNDAYAEILGHKHPQALGARFKDIWEEIWEDISPIINSAMHGKSSYFEDLHLVVERAGYPENAWFTFSYSPLYDDDGTIAGMYCAVVETTKTVRDRNLRSFQLSLADSLHPLTLPGDIVSTAVTMLAEHLAAGSCWYAEIDDVAGTFRTESGWFGPAMKPLPESGKIEDFSPELLATVRAGLEFVSDDLTVDPRTRDFAHLFRALGIGSILIIPVLKDGRLVFNINVAKQDPYVWTVEDIQAAKDVVDRTWVAMKNAVMQQRLEKERGQSDDILNRMGEGFMVVGPGGQVSRANSEALKLLQASIDAVIGKPYAQLWPEDIKGDVTQAYTDVLSSGATKIVEVRSAAAEIWLEFRVSSLGENGLAVFFRNITAQKQAAIALRRSDEHLASLFEHTAAGMAERDLQGRLIRVNERLCKILGRSREDLLGKDIHDLTHPDDLERSDTAFKNLLVDKRPFDIEKRYVRPDGTFVWVSTTVSLVRIEGQPTGSVLAVILDITERKQAEEALQDETRILELLNHSGKSLASTLDLHTLLQIVTDSGSALTGAEFGAFFYNGTDEQGDAYMLYTLSGAPREAFEEFGHPRATPVFKPTFAGDAPIRSDDILKDPRYGQMFPHFGMPKGHSLVRSYLAASVISRSGEVIGGLFFGHSQAAVFNERAERLIVGLAAQAAIAIDNARLYELAQKSAQERQTLLASERAARAEAERLNRSKDEFLAMLAHELRNPLAPVSAAAEILRIASNDPGRVRQVSNILSRQIEHFTHLIDDLMDVSRVTRGLIQLELAPLDLNAIIATAIEQVRPMIEARQHSLTTRLNIDHAGVMGDRTRLVQVVANLLTNAAKYTPPRGEITLDVETSEEAVRMSVTDNGNGIDASLLPHVFDLFTQGARGLDRAQGGLGIGLALVKAIVSLHEGEVHALSNGQGRGSTFTVAIPRSMQASDTFPERSAPNHAGQNLNVLLVDDNIDAAESLSMLLSAVGHQVTVASTAGSALRIAEQQSVDVFVLDIGLPDMSGYDLARALRKRPDLKNKVFIALTGYGQPEDRQLSKEAGFAHHLIKPVDNQLLFKLLTNVKSIGACI